MSVDYCRVVATLLVKILADHVPVSDYDTVAVPIPQNILQPKILIKAWLDAQFDEFVFF